MWTSLSIFEILFIALTYCLCREGENNSVYNFIFLLQAPRPPLPWDGIRNAISHGAECIQPDKSNGHMVQDEDCLFLNVYTTDIAENAFLPVMVFIHGGGFETGSGNVKAYGPDFLVNHGVVVVTMNYRLGALGFLCAGTEDVPGNAGLKDQVAALQWVKKNIEGFGGDPDQVTIFGQSAGGASTMFHVLSPMSKGLFKRAISMSGVPFCDWDLPHQPVRRAFVLGKLLGKETEDPNDLLDFLQEVPADKLVGLNVTVFASEEITRNIFKMYFFTPVIEKGFESERFLTQFPSEILKQGNINEVDIFIGHTNEESLFRTDEIVDTYVQLYDRYPELLVPTRILIQSTQDTIIEAADSISKYYFGSQRIDIKTIREFTNYITESTFVYPIPEFAARLSKIGKTKLFFYVFSCFSRRNVYSTSALKYNLTGAAHLDDTAYLFDPKAYNLAIDKNSIEYELVELVNTVFTNFAKYGTPTPDSSLNTWPEFDYSSRRYVEIGDQLTLGEHYKADVIDFWNSVFEKVGIKL